MSWSPQQEAAIKAVKAWIAERNRKPVYRLFGYAGTGKTTLAKELAKSVSGTVLYATFTGKAALQLRKKGCEGASTIHSLIYKVDVCQITGDAKFKINRDSDLRGAKLLIVDEVSMVDDQLARDLLSFKVPILVLGDPAQLPPVKGEGYFINTAPDVMLTEVHRQATENPITRLSMDIREGRALQAGQYGESLVASRDTVDEVQLRDLVLGADQCLCGLNRTRTAFNRRIRDLKGLAGARATWHPAVGDRIICLRNDREKALFNGGLWDVMQAQDKFGRFDLMTRSADEQRDPIWVSVRDEFWNGTEKTLEWRERREGQEFTFGWAITVHKSQGSEWDNVIVFDESGSFRDSRSNWLYTAVTRAAQRVTVIV